MAFLRTLRLQLITLMTAEHNAIYMKRKAAFKIQIDR
jgi:hypothetical protein